MSEVRAEQLADVVNCVREADQACLLALKSDLHQALRRASIRAVRDHLEAREEAELVLRIKDFQLVARFVALELVLELGHGDHQSLVQAAVELVILPHRVLLVFVVLTLVSG